MRRSFRFVYVGRICIVILHILFWGGHDIGSEAENKKGNLVHSASLLGGCMQKGREDIGVAEEKYWNDAE